MDTIEDKEKAEKAARLAAFIELAELLHGSRWQLPLSSNVGVSQATLSRIATGDRDLTPELERKLAAHAEVFNGGLVLRMAKISEKVRALRKRLGIAPSHTVSTGIVPAGEILAPDPDPEDDGPSFGP